SGGQRGFPSFFMRCFPHFFVRIDLVEQRVSWGKRPVAVWEFCPIFTDGTPSHGYRGSRKASNSPEYVPPLMATTMYCRPSSMYVIGDPLCGAGMNTAPASLPVALSYARSMAPRCPEGVVKKPLSPAMTRVLVTSVPTEPGRP